MHGDFSRDTFRIDNQFSSVLMQQGRVLLDADWNEQTAILLHYLRTLASDLIGPYWGPHEHELYGFEIRKHRASEHEEELETLLIGPGHYYVAGILCENEEGLDYFHQRHYPLREPRERDRLPTTPYLVYMDVWERGVTSVEAPSIREVALGGPDTSARSQIIWQVKVRDDFPDREGGAYGGEPESIHAWVAEWGRAGRGRLRARAIAPAEPGEPRPSAPDAGYRGPENQLYRVEVHHGGPAGRATFKWSRDNGSVVIPIRSLDGATLILHTLGLDDRHTLHVDDWIEIMDDDDVLLGHPGSMAQVAAVFPMERRVELKAIEPARHFSAEDGYRHPLVRRWDHKAGTANRGGLTLVDGAARISEGSEDHGWLNLEDGIQIQFEAREATHYHSGDYWLIPARVETANVEWPRDDEGSSLPRGPRGIRHYYAPLAIVDPTVPHEHGVTDLRRQIKKLWI